jgi:C4-type Zn-finger protein
MDAQIHKTPNCPTCGNRMFLLKAIPRVASVPELRIYKCEECGVRKTETKQAGHEPISRPKPNLYLVGPASRLLH